MIHLIEVRTTSGIVYHPGDYIAKEFSQITTMLLEDDGNVEIHSNNDVEMIIFKNSIESVKFNKLQ